MLSRWVHPGTGKPRRVHTWHADTEQGGAWHTLKAVVRAGWHKAEVQALLAEAGTSVPT